MTQSELIQTNWRAHIAINSIRITGRSPETMAELYDALNQRRDMRDRHLTQAEINHLNAIYLRDNAPDLLWTV